MSVYSVIISLFIILQIEAKAVPIYFHKEIWIQDYFSVCCAIFNATPPLLLDDAQLDNIYIYHRVVRAWV